MSDTVFDKVPGSAASPAPGIAKASSTPRRMRRKRRKAGV